MKKCGIQKGRIERLELRVGSDKRILPRLVIIAGSTQAQVDKRIARFRKAEKPDEFIEWRTTFIVPVFERPKEATRQPAPAGPTIEEELSGLPDAELEKMLQDLQKKAEEARK